MYNRKKSKISRKFGEKIFPEIKISEQKLTTAPGVHGAKRRRGGSEFGTQLKEKQKIKYVYGLREKQFRRAYDTALRINEPTPTALLKVLESRLDNVVYRSTFGLTREQSRQMISHGHISVNGKKVTVPSYSVKSGDIISFYKTKSKLVEERAASLSDKDIPGWLTLDVKKKTVTVVNNPIVDDLHQTFNVPLIIQYYSR